MLLQTLRALRKVPGGPGSIWMYIEALVRATGVPGRFACGFRTYLRFADIFRYWCDSIFKLILYISGFEVCTQAVQLVLNSTHEQLMQFIRLIKPIDNPEKLLPELVADWVNTKSVQRINISWVQKVRVNILISWVIEKPKSWIHYQRTLRDFTHQVIAIWDLNNHHLVWIIPNPGTQQSVKLSPESISTVPV